MKSAFHALKNKIKCKRGMSLAETLVSVIIIVLMTATLATTASLALNQFNRSRMASEALTLASTLRTIMTGELAYTDDVEVNSGTCSFKTQNYAVTSDEEMVKFYCSPSDDYGKVYIGDGTKNNVKVLADGSYPHGLGVKITSFTYDTTSHIFTVHLVIGKGDNSYYDDEFQVQNLNNAE